MAISTHDAGMIVYLMQKLTYSLFPPKAETDEYLVIDITAELTTNF
jgi:hypothetical protein